MLRFLNLMQRAVGRPSQAVRPVTGWEGRPTIAMSDPNPPDHGDTHAMLVAARREKLRRLAELGVDPWGGRFDGHQAIGEIRRRESEIDVSPPPAGAERQHAEQHGPRVRAAGRIVLSGTRASSSSSTSATGPGTIQVFIGKKQVGEQNWAVAQCFDLGDLIGVDGELKRTKTGELTIFAEQLHFLTKSLEPPPEKYHGLTDPELRQRMRYLDLIHGEGVLPRFLRRTKIVQSIRQTLAGEGFVEVEGPTLHAIAGGAAARPFVTHHNALDIELFLRIALELHLKRLLVGGMERVYEIGRVFRNEGISPRHNPEFTMLEAVPGLRRLPLDDGPDREADRRRDPRDRAGRSSSPGASKTIDFTPPLPGGRTTSCSPSTPASPANDAAAIQPLAEQIGFDTAGKHPDVVKSEVFEERVEDQLDGPDLRHRLPGQHLPADQAQGATTRRSPSGSSCSCRAWNWPTPTPS